MTLKINTTMYACDICHKSYDNITQAQECEERDNKNRKIENIENLKEFTITKEHLLLLKNMYVSWFSCEYGSPCIDPKRPYGNSDVENDIAELLNIKKTKENVDDYDSQEAKEYEDKQDYINDLEWKKELLDKFYYIHREMQIVLQICLTLGKFEEGKYHKKDNYDSLSWEKVK